MGLLKLKRSDLEFQIILTEQLWTLLYPVGGNIDLDSFDTTQLSILKRNICSIYLVESGLVNNIETDIMRPDYLRNLDADHITPAFLPYKKFNQFWSTLEVFLIWPSGGASNRLQENVKWTMVDTKTSSFDSLQEAELQRCVIIWYIENSADNQSVRIDIGLIHILDSKTENFSIGRAVIEKDIIWRKMRSDTEHLVNEISAIREGVIPCGKQDISSQSKVKLQVMTNTYNEVFDLLQIRLATEKHRVKPELQYDKRLLYNTNLSRVLCPARLCRFNEKIIFPVLFKSISEFLQLQELEPDLDDYKLDLIGDSCLLKLYLCTEIIFSQCDVLKDKSWSQFTKQHAFRQPHHDIGEQHLSRASCPSELTQVCMSKQYSLSHCILLNSLKLRQTNLGNVKLDLSEVFCVADLCLKDVALFIKRSVLQSNCRLLRLNGYCSFRCDYLKECCVQYFKKKQKINLTHFHNDNRKLCIPDASCLLKMYQNAMRLYSMCNCMSHCAHLKELPLSCANMCDKKLDLPVASLISPCRSYPPLQWNRIRFAKSQCNSYTPCTLVQLSSAFYLSNSEEKEQSYFGWFAGNRWNICAVDTNILPATPASTEDKMVQKMARLVSVYSASSRSPKSASYSTPVGVTEHHSDFISVRHGNKPTINLNVSFRVKIDLLDVLSVHYEVTKEQPSVKSREKVNLLSSRRKSDISSLVKVFFTIVGKVLDVRSNVSKTWLHIASESEMEIKSDKGIFEVGSDKRNVNDIDLKGKKKHYLHHQIRIPFEQLPQPILNRDAIVCFFESQTRNTLGGSSVSPAEHRELRAILNQLASDNAPGTLITMKYEMLRLCTMKTFPGRDRPFAVRIVGAGFYYAGNRDQVICYCCGSRKDNWVIGDIPLSIHKTLFPSCSFLTNNTTVNVPIIKRNQTRSSAEVPQIGIQISNGSNQLDTAQGESSLMSLSSKQTQVNISSGNHQMLVTNKGSPANQLMASGGKNVLDSRQTSVSQVYSMEDPLPMYPQFSSKTIRINSFQGWPSELIHRPEEMAECGFFYAGFSDCVRCFNCGVGLRQWINEDDPWIEHTRWSTSCLYVLKMKGEEFVSLVKMAVEIAKREEASQNDSRVNQSSQHNAEAILADTEKEDSHRKISADSTAPVDFTSNTGTRGGAIDTVVTPTSSTGNAEMQNYMLTNAAQSVLDMGYEAKLVLRAIERVLMKKGTVALTGQIIMEAVFEIEEDKGNSKLPPTSQSEQENKRTAQDTAAAERTTAEELAIDPEQIVRKHKELREVTICKICLDKTISVVFLPCGHLVACLECAPAMRKCPICRSLIKGTVKTFLG